MADPAVDQTGQDARDARQRRSRLWQALAIGALVVIIILIFLLLWDPFGGRRNVADEGRHPGMVGSIADIPASSEYVALWMKPGKEIGAVLRRHGLDPEALLFADEKSGYYVVSVGKKDPAAVVADLKGDSALYDAGRIFDEGDSKTTSGSAPATP